MILRGTMGRPSSRHRRLAGASRRGSSYRLRPHSVDGVMQIVRDRGVNDLDRGEKLVLRGRVRASADDPRRNIPIGGLIAEGIPLGLVANPRPRIRLRED